MKILIISDAWLPQVNGVVRTYQNLETELTKMGHFVQVIGPADFPINIPTPGYKEIRLALFPYRRLKRMIKSFKPDHIHVATEGPLGWAGRKFCIRHNLRFSTTYHTHFPDYIAKRIGKPFPFLYEPVRQKAIATIRDFHAAGDGMFVATQSLEDELRSWGFAGRMERLIRGVHLDQFSPGAPTLFHDMKRPVALYVGRIAIEKNLEDFLRMDWDGSKVLVGDGPSKTYLAKKYPDAHFVGKKEGAELAAHYRSSDVFIFPSRTDTFGIVLIEALASGLPVAGYNVTGPKDIITDDFMGALHDDDLAAAVRQAMAHTDKERRAAHVKAHYTWDNVAQQFLDTAKTIQSGAE